MNQIMTDGCTAGPLSSFLNSFAYDCCRFHDLSYANGITTGDKLNADLALFQCVAATGHPVWAIVMLAAVATAGWLWWARRPN